MVKPRENHRKCRKIRKGDGKMIWNTQVALLQASSKRKHGFQTCSFKKQVVSQSQWCLVAHKYPLHFLSQNYPKVSGGGSKTIQEAMVLMKKTVGWPAKCVLKRIQWISKSHPKIDSHWIWISKYMKLDTHPSNEYISWVKIPHEMPRPCLHAWRSDRSSARCSETRPLRVGL